MNKEKLKDKYTPLIAEISEIMGLGKSTDVLKLCAVADSFLGKPTDILKLCTAIDSFFRPLEKRIEELEKENAELKEQIKEMKCCGNCKHRDDMTSYCEKHKKEIYIFMVDCRCNDWELF